MLFIAQNMLFQKGKWTRKKDGIFETISAEIVREKSPWFAHSAGDNDYESYK
jgi:hypothetical protein